MKGVTVRGSIRNPKELASLVGRCNVFLYLSLPFCRQLINNKQSNFKILDFKVSKYQSFKISKFQSFQVSKFQNFQISKFRNLVEIEAEY